MIRVLPDHIVNQISAGEVIERPASVVRELIDNSLDAGASEITVEIEEGGRALVRVIDNGGGMSREDAPLAFGRHATSKLQAVEDLARISSLGFRGEALPSIASVSRVRLVTRRPQDSTATEVLIEGGEITSTGRCAAQPGTMLEVRSLFYNTPARRKFLKHEKSEELRVKQFILHSSLVRPQVRYRLFADGREVLNLPRREEVLERAAAIFRGSSVTFARSIGPLQLEGLLLHPSLAQGESSACLIFVNGRLVSDRAVLRAIRDGFSSTLKDREFPVGFVSIRLLPEFVDVNVHPQKSEVRFSSQQAVFVAVRDSVREAVNAFKGPVQSGFEYRQNLPAAGGNAGPHEVAESAAASSYRQAVGLLYAGAGALQAASGQGFRFSELSFIGQALECYLFCEHQGAVYVVDMHAAHERYNYNLLRNSMREGRATSQKLLVPLRVVLSEAAAQACLAHAELLERAGFEIRVPGEDGTVMVHALPAVMGTKDPTVLIREIAAAEFSEEAGERINEALDHLAARIACHASIRSGQALSREEVYALFAALDQSEFSSACPHGRPVVVSFSEAQIESWFGRDR